MAAFSYTATLFSSAFVNAWRHRTMTVITVLIVSLMMTTLGMFLVIENELSLMIASIGKRVNLIVYLEDDAPPSDVLALREELLADPRVNTVEYITKEEALERLRQYFKDEPDLLQPLLDNPLQASLEVRSDDPDYLLTQVDNLAAKTIVEDVDLPQEPGKEPLAGNSDRTHPRLFAGRRSRPRGALRYRQRHPPYRLRAARRD